MLRRGSRIGKYRIEGCLANGPMARVYRAFDTIEGGRVALKVVTETGTTDDLVRQFRAEARVMVKLDHPNILPLKDASRIDGHFVLVTPLGHGSLADRLGKRLSATRALDYSSQLLRALAHAHERRVMHCDVKPENMILFDGGTKLRLADFGIARFAHRTMRGSGSGTLGYISPEQAMGKPSLRSDVFAAALVIYRMMSGHLPEWPYTWPLAGHDRLRRTLHPDFVRLLQRCLAVDPRKRFESAVQMERAFRRLEKNALRKSTGSRSRNAVRKSTTRRTQLDWRQVRFKSFKTEFGRTLATRYECPACEGPISEAMKACPWCGSGLAKFPYPADSTFPQVCARCDRGMKLDWNYCPWCYGPGFEAESREYTDKRYQGKCANPACDRKDLMPFMRYCPWCRKKVERTWKIEGTAKESCRSCGHGIAGDYWDFCPWCSKSLQ